MKRKTTLLFIAMVCALAAIPASAQFNLKKAIGGASKAVQAMTLTDEQMAAYVKESVDWMDKHNPVLPDDDPYTIRLNKLTEGISETAVNTRASRGRALLRKYMEQEGVCP